MEINAKPLKGAIIGYGTAGALGHGRAYQKRQDQENDVKIRAIADVSDARRQAASVDFPEAQIYTDADILLEREAKHLDFVDIATPHFATPALALKALKLGLHVLCEIPYASTFEEAIILCERAAQEKRVFFPYVPVRFSPILREAHEAVSNRLIGKVHSVFIDQYLEDPPEGIAEWNPLWRRDRKFAIAGVGAESGYSAIYLALEWLGTRPTHVSAKIGHSNPTRGEFEDSFFVTLSFPNGVAGIRTIWNGGVRKFLHTVHGDGGAVTINNDKLELAVMQRVIRPEIQQRESHWTYEKKLIPSHWDTPGKDLWFSSGFERFKHALVKAEYVGKEASLAKLATQLLALAYRSAKEGSREIFVESF